MNLLRAMNIDNIMYCVGLYSANLVVLLDREKHLQIKLDIRLCMKTVLLFVS